MTGSCRTSTSAPTSQGQGPRADSSIKHIHMDGPLINDQRSMIIDHPCLQALDCGHNMFAGAVAFSSHTLDIFLPGTWGPDRRSFLPQRKKGNYVRPNPNRVTLTDRLPRHTLHLPDDLRKKKKIHQFSNSRNPHEKNHQRGEKCFIALIYTALPNSL